MRAIRYALCSYINYEHEQNSKPVFTYIFLIYLMSSSQAQATIETPSRNISTLTSKNSEPLHIFNIPSITVNSMEEFRKQYQLEYACEEESCELKDITIDGQGFLVIGGIPFWLSPQAFVSLCKLNGIPHKFVESVPTFVFSTILDDLKLVSNIPLHYYVSNSYDSQNKHTIFNFTYGDNARINYDEPLFDFLDSIEDQEY